MLRTKSDNPTRIATLSFCTYLLSASFSASASMYSTSYSYDVPNGIVTRTDPNGTDIAYH